MNHRISRLGSFAVLSLLGRTHYRLIYGGRFYFHPARNSPRALEKARTPSLSEIHALYLLAGGGRRFRHRPLEKFYGCRWDSKRFRVSFFIRGNLSAKRWSWAEQLQIISGYKPNHLPGAEFHYSNLGYDLLAPAY